MITEVIAFMMFIAVISVLLVLYTRAVNRLKQYHINFHKNFRQNPRKHTHNKSKKQHEAT